MMTDQFFLTTLAGLSVSLAGFASLIAWLREDMTSWDDINLWRTQTIVRQSLTIAFMALALIPLYKLTHSEPATIRIGSGFVTLFLLYDMMRAVKRDAKVWDPYSLYIAVFASASFAIPQVINFWMASLGWLQLGFVLILTSPAGIFYNFVREMGRPKLPPKK